MLIMISIIFFSRKKNRTTKIWQLNMSLAFNLKSSKFIPSYSSMTKLDVCDLSFTSRKSCIFLFAFLFGETNLFEEVSSEWHERLGHTVLKSFLKHTINIFIPLIYEICFWFKSLMKYNRNKICLTNILKK